MSLRDAELSRSRRAARARTKQQSRKKKVQGRCVGIGHNQGPSLDEALAPLLDHRCLTFRQWCQLNGISERTGRRLIATGQGPIITRLSPRRIGISIANNKRWQAAREQVT